MKSFYTIDMPREKLTLEQLRHINREMSLRKPRCRYCGFVLLGEEDDHLAACKDFKPRGKITRAPREGLPPPSKQTYLGCEVLGVAHFWESGREKGTVVCIHCREEDDVPMRIMMMGR